MPHKSGGGRPCEHPVSKYTERRVARLVEALELGASLKLAAGAAGISYETLRRWMREGEQDPGSQYAELVSRIHEAEGRLAVVCMSHIQRAAGRGAWQASAWILERRFPDLYGRKNRTTVEHAGSVTVDSTSASLVEELLAGGDHMGAHG